MKKQNTKTLMMRIQDNKDTVDMWEIAIQDFFNFGKDLLSEYIAKYPKLKQEFMEKRKTEAGRYRPSDDRPCLIQFTDGEYFKRHLEQQKIDRITKKLMDATTPDTKLKELMEERWYETTV
tara:strand:+ start:68 stop:430 length:363 start_codon:yes stop_codon:yes gene_type:complete